MEIAWVNKHSLLVLEFEMQLHNKVKVPIYRITGVNHKIGTRGFDSIMKNESKELKKYAPNAIKRNYPTYRYNCHSVTFASRRGWLNDGETPLLEEGYKELKDTDLILDGDILSYIAKEGKDLVYTHSAIVVNGNNITVDKLNNDGTVLMTVVSKWGPWGEYIHQHNECPYTDSNSDFDHYRVYRFIRTS